LFQDEASRAKPVFDARTDIAIRELNSLIQ
jgi:hypothetical protein